MTVDAAEDPALPVPSLPAPGREAGLDLSTDGLRDDARVVHGAGLRIVPGDAGFDVLHRDETVAESIRLEGASAGPRTVTAAGAEQHLQLAGTAVNVRAVASWSAPVAFFEWSVPGRLAWTVPGSRIRWRAADRGLVVERGGERILFALPAPGSFAVDAAERLEIRADCRHLAGPVLLTVARLDRERPERAVRVAGRPRVAARAARGWVRRLGEECLQAEIPDAGEDERLADAVVALSARDAAGPVEDSPAADRVLAEALLATGQPGPARRLIDDRAPVGSAAEAVGRILLAARYLAWTGDRATVSGARDRLAGAVAVCRSGPRSADCASALAVAAWLAEELGTPLPGAAGREAAEPDVGIEVDAAGSDWPLPAARVIGDFVRTLGVHPDASRGRLTLRPRLPDRWHRLAVRNLRIGGASVELGYTLGNGVARFRLTQREGPAPVQLVFEPELAGAAVRATRIEGRLATLESEPAAGRWRVPVQLVLDRPRTVEVEMEASGD